MTNPVGKNWYYEHGCPQVQQLRNKAWRSKNREKYNETCRLRRQNNPEVRFKSNRYQAIRRILNGVQVKAAILQKYRITADDIQHYELRSTEGASVALHKSKVC